MKDQAGNVPGSSGVSSATSGKLASPSSQYLPRKGDEGECQEFAVRTVRLFVSKGLKSVPGSWYVLSKQ